MDLETSEAPDSARNTIPTENIHQIENEGQAPLEKINTPELSTTDATAQDTHMQNSTMETPPSLPLTHALEALLGGLDPPADAHTSPVERPVMEEQPQPAAPITVDQPEIEKPSDQAKIPGLVSLNGNADQTQPKPTSEEEPVPDVDTKPTPPQEESKPDEATSNDAIMEDVQNVITLLGGEPIPAESAEVASASEAISAPAVENSSARADAPIEDGEEHPEWEIDSSPIESSTNDSAPKSKPEF
jgi:H/ACA ribonucleoprotein complex non-core subunit NAF1